ncbi:MAG: imidazolonepropionase [Proteobacteria bacterium]|nr:imidazolonepropionase [Pseudomonadota bacterium]
MSQILYRKIRECLTLEGVKTKKGVRPQEADLSIIKNAAIVVQKGRIEWVGPERALPKKLLEKSCREIILDSQSVLPGFVECHTHTVFAGHRADEFELRNQGATYQEVAQKGGGILSTMKKTRLASEAELFSLAQRRANRFLEQGVTRLEVKSGYGLDLKSELKSLKVAQKIRGPQVTTTFLGAHAKPPEFKTYGDYLDYLVREVLPKVKSQKLSSRVDIFIEKGFFEASDSERYLRRAKDLGFEITIHADQLSLSGGARIASELRALSADHVIKVTALEILMMKEAGVIAVLLPAADLYLRCDYPPARQLIDQGVRVALATDFNPGSSPTQDLSLVGLLARLEMKMTLPEVIAAYTHNAALALGLEDEGTLTLGSRANFFSTDLEWRELFYSIGQKMPSQIFINGRRVKNA